MSGRLKLEASLRLKLEAWDLKNEGSFEDKNKPSHRAKGADNWHGQPHSFDGLSDQAEAGCCVHELKPWMHSGKRKG